MRTARINFCKLEDVMKAAPLVIGGPSCAVQLPGNDAVEADIVAVKRCDALAANVLRSITKLHAVGNERPTARPASWSRST